MFSYLFFFCCLWMRTVGIIASDGFFRFCKSFVSLFPSNDWICLKKKLHVEMGKMLASHAKITVVTLTIAKPFQIYIGYCSPFSPYFFSDCNVPYSIMFHFMKYLWFLTSYHNTKKSNFIAFSIWDVFNIAFNLNVMYRSVKIIMVHRFRYSFHKSRLK